MWHKHDDCAETGSSGLVIKPFDSLGNFPSTKLKLAYI